jgi:hypothetical protein
VSIHSSVEGVTVLDSLADDHLSIWKTWLSPWKQRRGGFELNPDLVQEGLTKEDGGWHLSFEWVALQPQRVRVVEPQLFIRSTKDTIIEFTAKVFADSFAEPLILKAELDLAVQVKRTRLADFVANLKSSLKEKPDDATDEAAEESPEQPRAD